MKVVFATPTVTEPFAPYLKSLEECLPAVEAAGFEHGATFTVGNPYISGARATMLRNAMDARADLVVFIDHDVSWRPQDMVKLLQTEGDVVAGTYRFKNDGEEYMGVLETDHDHRPVCRADGAIKAKWVPGGFLSLTKEAVDAFMREYPELVYGPRYSPSVDLFNHGAIENIWMGEDVAFSKRWREKCGDIWIVPDLDLDHHSKDRVWPGNFHKFLLRQPGGSEAG